MRLPGAPSGRSARPPITSRDSGAGEALLDIWLYGRHEELDSLALEVKRELAERLGSNHIHVG